MDAADILSVIFQNLASALPLRIVKDNQQGVRWTFGRSSEPLEYGIYFFFPLIQSITCYDATEVPVDLGTQTLKFRKKGTIDGTYMVRAQLTYEICDARLYATILGETDALNLIQTEGRIVLADHIFHLSDSDDILEEKESLEEKVRETLQKNFEPKGVSILRFGITELGHLDRTYRHVGIHDSEGYSSL